MAAEKQKKKRINKKVYKNQDQKKVGQAGEQKFFEHYKKDGIVYGNGKNVDFINVNTRKTIELKTDTHSFPEETQNVFLEKYGNVFKESLGGPYKSLKDGVDFFCYYFVNSRKCFWFNAETLVSYLEKNQDNLRLKVIFNKGYDSSGYLVPVEDLEDLIIKEDEF